MPSKLLKRQPKRKRGRLQSILLAVVGLLFLMYFCCGVLIVSLRSFNPPTTAIQLQRQVEAIIAKRPYTKLHAIVPLKRISPDLQHAVVAAEDTRFFVHHGVDWIETAKVWKTYVDTHKIGRGASTITQQLARTLFLGTERSIIRKALEFTLVPMMELALPKTRILELYLNEIEWGPGIYGVESASEHWYHTPAASMKRDQAARLAALIPSPLKRTPAGETEYAGEIEERMKQMGW